jgi:hypothetical protein
VLSRRHSVVVEQGDALKSVLHTIGGIRAKRSTKRQIVVGPDAAQVETTGLRRARITWLRNTRGNASARRHADWNVAQKRTSRFRACGTRARTFGIAARQAERLCEKLYAGQIRPARVIFAWLVRIARGPAFAFTLTFGRGVVRRTIERAAGKKSDETATQQVAMLPQPPKPSAKQGLASFRAYPLLSSQANPIRVTLTDICFRAKKPAKPADPAASPTVESVGESAQCAPAARQKLISPIRPAGYGDGANRRRTSASFTSADFRTVAR